MIFDQFNTEAPELFIVSGNPIPNTDFLFEINRHNFELDNWAEWSDSVLW